MKKYFYKNSTFLITLAIIALLLFMAARGMETRDFIITLLRSLSVGSVTFLVAAGFSLIFGLLDVLNLAQGTLYMIGAYIGWTVYVRPDTFVDLVTPLALFIAGFTLKNLWTILADRVRLNPRPKLILGWGMILAGFVIFAVIVTRYPIAMWDLDVYTQSPITYSYMADQGVRIPPVEAVFEKILPAVAFIGILFSSALAASGLAFLKDPSLAKKKVSWKDYLAFGILIVVAVLVLAFNTPLTNALLAMNTTWLFLIAVVVAVGCGLGLGALMETTLIRPLYNRPIYQLMLTIGLSAIGVQIVQAVWGRPEFVLPKPALFNGTGENCPATSLSAWFQYKCSTMFLLDGRVRVYDEIFIPIIGIVVLVGVWILLKRTRLGMVIRAGVQDRQMVEALGINVRRVFTQVFALGVGLAAFGGVIAAPSNGLSTSMGEKLLLSALMALAIGGLTSYPGAALGSFLVGLIQQFIIKYGQIGISIPLTEIVFKPSPAIVPASTVLLMVIVLLILPSGLLGKKE